MVDIDQKVSRFIQKFIRDEEDIVLQGKGVGVDHFKTKVDILPHLQFRQIDSLIL